MATRIGLALIALYFLAIGCAGRQPTHNDNLVTTTAQPIRRTLAESHRGMARCSTEPIVQTGQTNLRVSLDAPLEGYYWITAYRGLSAQQGRRSGFVSFGTVYARARERIDCHLPVRSGEGVGLLEVQRLEPSRDGEGYEGSPVRVPTHVQIGGHEMAVNLDNPCTWGICPILLGD